MIKPIAGAITVALLAANATAVELIPRQEGWNGFINLGVGGVKTRNNEISTLMNGKIDVGSDRIDSLDSNVERESFMNPVAAFELGYVFEGSRTQVFLGNLLEDYIRFDFTTRLGVRHHIENIGIFGLSGLSTPMAGEVDVWQDPYQTDVKRNDTLRESKGARLSWDGIFGSQFDFRVSSREVDIDKERSGEALVAAGTITAAEAAMLDRNGDIKQADIRYAHKINDEHGLQLGLKFVDYDKDGEAMANDGAEFTMTYLRSFPDSKDRLVTNFSYGSYEYDKENPVYGVKDEYDRLGVSVAYFHMNPFGLGKPWALNGTLAYGEDDHEINFYDSEISSVSVGMLRRF